MEDRMWYQLNIRVRGDDDYFWSMTDWFEDVTKLILRDQSDEPVVQDWIMYEAPYTILRPEDTPPLHPAHGEDWDAGFAMNAGEAPFTVCGECMIAISGGKPYPYLFGYSEFNLPVKHLTVLVD